MKSSSYKEMRRIGKHCEPFLHQSNLPKLQLERGKVDVKTFEDETPYIKGKIAELSTRSKISEMNYKYCIASQSCPERMKFLNQCYTQYKPEIVKALFKVGSHDLVCNKEKKAVERCVGSSVMSVTRNISESS